ncbi:phage tail tape measure protein [Pseudomonas sp.]|uniref:phage tail tape measure protein n=1 Tax=Pseudomonas sp. TaxID=306 RepID=UPI0028AD6080|nr:phage tail tape measure protein [Pseudomonas sp.]
MTTIASLGLQVDSGDAVEAKDNLDLLAQAGGRAEQAAAGLAAGFGKAATAASGLATAEAKVTETTDEAMARLTAMAKASLEASDYHKSLAASLTSTSSAMNSASSSATDWAAYQAEINARGRTLLETEERLAESARQAAAAAGIQGEGLQALLGKINPAVAALDKLDQQQVELQKYRNAGLLDEETFREYSVRIDASRQKLGEFSEGMHRAGISTGQTQAALQQLPAQFTDIFTSLAGGQNPLLVLIQQGGQIADSFGGIGPTLDVLREKIKSVLGLGGGIGTVGDALEIIGSGGKAAAEGAEAAGESLGDMADGANTAADAAKNAKEAADALSSATPPLASGLGIASVAVLALAATIGTLIYGYKKGSEEADEFSDALILTGNYAGTSADALGDMARRVSEVNGTVGDAAEILAKLAGNGKTTEGAFEAIANAAVAMEDATGKAFDATIAEFVKIADDPVKAAKALNDQYHFLTASVYSQIVALKEQGNEIGATKLLTDVYADTVMRRSKDVTENLSLWERGWKGIKDAASEALDGINSVGRAKTFDDQIAALEARLTGSEAYDVGGARINAQEVSPVERQKIEAQIQSLRLAKQEQLNREAARKTEQDRQSAAVLGIQLISKEAEAARSEVTKLEDRLDKLRKARDKNVTNGSFNGETEKMFQQAEKDLKKRLADARKSATGRAPEVDLSSFNDQKNTMEKIVGEYRNHQKELEAAQKAGLISEESYSDQRIAMLEQQKAEVTNAYEGEIRALEEARGRSTTSAQQRIQLDQKIADARAAMVKAQKDADTELSVLATNEQGRLAKQARAVQTYTDALDQQVKALQLQGLRAADGLGLGDRQRGLQDQQNGITDRMNQQRLDLANQYGDGSRGMSLDEYNQKLAALSKTEKDLQETTIANYDQMTVAQGDWRKGASSAFQNYLEQARDVAGQTKALFSNAFSSMEDAVVNFAMTGKFSFADFTKSILADMARIATQQAASGLLSSLVSFGTSAAASYFGGGATSAGSTQAGYSPEIMDNFVSGQRAGGGPVAANSLYQVNELGPELLNQGGKTYLMMGGQGGTITPLGTGPASTLATTSTSGTMISVSAPVNVAVADRSDEGMELDQTLLQQNMQKQMQLAAEKAVADSWRPGGVSYRNTKGGR